MNTVLSEGLKELKRGMVADAVEDYTDLSFFVDDVREAFGVSDEDDVMFYTVAVLHQLLDEGLLRAGLPTDGGGFEEWDLTPYGVVDLIRRAWVSLERTPTLGEVVWFDATEKGEAYAEEELSASGS